MCSLSLAYCIPFSGSLYCTIEVWYEADVIYLLSHVADVYSANRHARVLCSKDTIDTKVMNYTNTSAHTHTQRA